VTVEHLTNVSKLKSPPSGGQSATQLFFLGIEPGGFRAGASAASCAAPSPDEAAFEAFSPKVSALAGTAAPALYLDLEFT
jgi:hypothetical protein